MNVILAALAVSAGAAIAVGCATETSSSFADPTASSPPLDGEGASSGSPTSPATDASAAKPTPYRGNPLCKVTDTDSCMPDDDGYRRTTGTSECALPQGDASDGGTVNEPQAHACRISKDANGLVASTCKEGEAGSGGDGATCENGRDCAAGFDCVAGEKGSKTCRHYCCAGTCKAQASQNGSATFCDVQPLVDVNQMAPVCMPLKRCTLLSTGECNANETCAVVTEAGETGCVTIGDKQVGASCDEDHCAAKLTCLGQPGSRKCFKLCKVNASDCGPSQVCTTSTVFKDPDFGICQKP